MMRKPVCDRGKVGGADSSSTWPSPERASLEAMKTQPYASLEPRLQRAGRDLEAQLESLFERCPDLWGFAVQDRDNELFVSDVGITDRKSTRLNSSHSQISYAVFCLKKKIIHHYHNIPPTPCPFA